MKSTNSTKKYLRLLVPYVITAAVIITAVAIGSYQKSNSTSYAPIMNNIGESSFSLDSNQLDAAYIVANLADHISLPSYGTISENYVSIALQYKSMQNSDTKIEKPNIIDTSNLAHGIQEYIVKEGDTLDTIVAYFKANFQTAADITANQIRWSNNMKNSTVSPGQKLYIPAVPGILYTVKVGDTIEGLAAKYKSDAKSIIHSNDLEITGLVVGSTIILPSGELPEKERPEYVPPAPRPSYTSSLTGTSSGVRHNVRFIANINSLPNQPPNNSGAWGQCTWYAWYWRYQYGLTHPGYQLPSGALGNARDWVRTLGGQFYVDHNPRVGDVVQTSTSGNGHVAVVVGVSATNITIREMNFKVAGVTSGRGNVIESEIPIEIARNFNYIHQRK